MLILDPDKAFDVANAPTTNSLIFRGLLTPPPMPTPETRFCLDIIKRYKNESPASAPFDFSIIDSMFQFPHTVRFRTFLRRRIIIKLWFYNICGLRLSQAIAFYDSIWFEELSSEITLTSDYIDFMDGIRPPLIILFYVDSIRNEAVLSDDEIELIGQTIRPYSEYYTNQPPPSLASRIH